MGGGGPGMDGEQRQQRGSVRRYWAFVNVGCLGNFTRRSECGKRSRVQQMSQPATIRVCFRECVCTSASSSTHTRVRSKVHTHTHTDTLDDPWVRWEARPSFCFFVSHLVLFFPACYVIQLSSPGTPPCTLTSGFKGRNRRPMEKLQSREDIPSVPVSPPTNLAASW